MISVHLRVCQTLINTAAVSTVRQRAPQRTGAGIGAHGRPDASACVAGRTRRRGRPVRCLRLRHLVGRAAAGLRFLGRRAPPPTAPAVADARVATAPHSLGAERTRTQGRGNGAGRCARGGVDRDVSRRAGGARAAFGSKRDGPPGYGDQPESHRRERIAARASRARSARSALFGRAGAGHRGTVLGRRCRRRVQVAPYGVVARGLPCAARTGAQWRCDGARARIGTTGVRPRRRGRTVLVPSRGASTRGRALRVPDRAGPGGDVVDDRRPRPARARKVDRRRPGLAVRVVGVALRALTLPSFPDPRVRLWYVPHAIGRPTRECRWRSSAARDSGVRLSPPT